MLEDEWVVPRRVGLAGGAVTAGRNSAMAEKQNTQSANKLSVLSFLSAVSSPRRSST